MSKLTITPHIRWCIRRDMPEVLGIENARFEFPWSEDDFIGYLRQRNCIAMVAEHDERIVGFMVYDLHKTELHLLNFAVHAACDRRDVGTAMIRKLASKLYSGRRERIVFHVRESNLDGLLFLKAMGFVATDIIRGKWIETEDDAIVMTLRHGEFRGDSEAVAKVRVAQ